MPKPEQKLEPPRQPNHAASELTFGVGVGIGIGIDLCSACPTPGFSFAERARQRRTCCKRAHLPGRGRNRNRNRNRSLLYVSDYTTASLVNRVATPPLRCQHRHDLVECAILPEDVLDNCPVHGKSLAATPWRPGFRFRYRFRFRFRPRPRIALLSFVSFVSFVVISRNFRTQGPGPRAQGSGPRRADLRT